MIEVQINSSNSGGIIKVEGAGSRPRKSSELKKSSRLGENLETRDIKCQVECFFWQTRNILAKQKVEIKRRIGFSLVSKYAGLTIG